jgi:hypothetical protein
MSRSEGSIAYRIGKAAGCATVKTLDSEHVSQRNKRRLEQRLTQAATETKTKTRRQKEVRNGFGDGFYQEATRSTPPSFEVSAVNSRDLERSATQTTKHVSQAVSRFVRKASSHQSSRTSHRRPRPAVEITWNPLRWFGKGCQLLAVPVRALREATDSLAKTTSEAADTVDRNVWGNTATPVRLVGKGVVKVLSVTQAVDGLGNGLNQLSGGLTGEIAGIASGLTTFAGSLVSIVTLGSTHNLVKQPADAVAKSVTDLLGRPDECRAETTRYL